MVLELTNDRKKEEYNCYDLQTMWASINIECNVKTANFLNITFGLENNVYELYRKANDKPTYINKNSNHPPSILNSTKIYRKKTVRNIIK